jgi:hypothetical protein
VAGLTMPDLIPFSEEGPEIGAYQERSPLGVLI